MQPLRRAGRDALADGDRGEAAPPGGGDGVEHERAAGPQHAAGLGDQRRSARRRARAPRRRRRRRRPRRANGRRRTSPRTGDDAVVAGLRQRGRRQVEPDVPVARARRRAGRAGRRRRPGRAAGCPSRAAGGTSRARAAAIQCSIAKRPRGVPPGVGEVVVLLRGRCSGRTGGVTGTILPRCR